MTEREAYIAFNLTEKIGAVGVGELVAKFGTVAAAWEAYPNKVARSGGEVDLASELKLAEKYKVTILTPADREYPDRLRETKGHPLALYVKGDVAALSKPGIAIVGTRRATPYGRDQAYVFGRDLAASGWSVISGLALGIDAESHKGALAAGGITVGIIGSGLDKFYPDENRELAREIIAKGGAVVSEFPFGRTPDTQTFPQRNHVVAALAHGVLAIEAPLKSGTLITTGIAADLGRTVMALPGRVDSKMSQGCLALIRDGARMVRNARDVNEEFSQLGLGIGENRDLFDFAAGSVPTDSGSVPMPEGRMTIEEAMIMREIDVEGVPMESLVGKTGLDPMKVNSLVMGLRMRGKVRFFPGNRVALPRPD